LTKKQPGPNRDWLTVVKTPHARSRIRAWLRAGDREQNIQHGRQSVETELKAWNLKHFEDVPASQRREVVEALNFHDQDSLLAAIGEGMVSVGQVTRRLFPPAAKTAGVTKRPVATGRVVIAGDLPYTLAPCCKPV